MLLKVCPGDIIGVPAEKGTRWGFVLARVIRNKPSVWVEVFDKFHHNFHITQEEIKKNNFSKDARLFQPIYAALDFGKYFGKVKWPILATDPIYQPDKSDMSSIEFEGDSYLETGVYSRGGVEHSEEGGLRRDLEDTTIYSNPQLVRRVNLYLSGYMKKGAPWNARQKQAIIEKEGIEWWVDGINACNAHADAVSLKFSKR